MVWAQGHATVAADELRRVPAPQVRRWGVPGRDRHFRGVLSQFVCCGMALILLSRQPPRTETITQSSLQTSKV